MAKVPMRCMFDLASVPWQAYRLPSDGRKTQYRSIQRRMVGQELATHANADGTNIWASVETMAGRIGFSERTFRYVLDELVELGFLENGKQRGVKGGRIRKLNIAAILQAGQTLHHSDQTLQDAESKPCNITAETLQDSGQSLQHSATNPAPSGVQPTAPPTATKPPFLPPTEKAGGQEFSFSEWQRNLPAPMNTEAMARYEKQVRAFVESKGAGLARGYVEAWITRRDIRGLRDLWGAFLREAELHATEAFERTPEGCAAAQRREDEMVEAAAALSTKNALEREARAQEDEESVEETIRMLREASRP